MRIFLAGASGALGRRLVPMLTRQGHSVIGTTRSATKGDALRALGAEPIVLDMLDRDAVLAEVTTAKPDAVIHQGTALSGSPNFRRIDQYFAETNRLRTVGTDNLLAAAGAVGAHRFVAQSYTGWPNPRTGGPVKTEDDPLDPNPFPGSAPALAAIRHVESAVPAATDVGGIVLRYGSFYGPGNTIGRGGDLLEMIRKRRFPVVAGGNGIWSFIHIDDAASATVAAVESDATGVFNIVDDDPAPVHVWLPYLAELIGAKPPRRVPGWLVRPALGPYGIAAMTSLRGSSNAKAKRVLGWRPAYPSWRQGFRTGLG
jgi:nucleoside-diphosphate-sugar epimerase